MPDCLQPVGKEEKNYLGMGHQLELLLAAQLLQQHAEFQQIQLAHESADIGTNTLHCCLFL